MDENLRKLLEGRLVVDTPPAEEPMVYIKRPPPPPEAAVEVIASTPGRVSVGESSSTYERRPVGTPPYEGTVERVGNEPPVPTPEPVTAPGPTAVPTPQPPARDFLSILQEREDLGRQMLKDYLQRVDAAREQDRQAAMQMGAGGSIDAAEGRARMTGTPVTRPIEPQSALKEEIERAKGAHEIMSTAGAPMAAVAAQKVADAERSRAAEENPLSPESVAARNAYDQAKGRPGAWREDFPDQVPTAAAIKAILGPLTKAGIGHAALRSGEQKAQAERQLKRDLANQRAENEKQRNLERTAASAEVRAASKDLRLSFQEDKVSTELHKEVGASIPIRNSVNRALDAYAVIKDNPDMRGIVFGPTSILRKYAKLVIGGDGRIVQWQFDAAGLEKELQNSDLPGDKIDIINQFLQARAQLVADYVFKKSGKAVTNAERSFLESAIGMGGAGTESEFVQGIMGLRETTGQEIASAYDRVSIKYPGAVVANSRGISPSDFGVSWSPPGVQAPRPAAPPPQKGRQAPPIPTNTPIREPTPEEAARLGIGVQKKQVTYERTKDGKTEQKKGWDVDRTAWESKGWKIVGG